MSHSDPPTRHQQAVPQAARDVGWERTLTIITALLPGGHQPPVPPPQPLPASAAARTDPEPSGAARGGWALQRGSRRGLLMAPPAHWGVPRVQPPQETQSLPCPLSVAALRRHPLWVLHPPLPPPGAQSPPCPCPQCQKSPLAMARSRLDTWKLFGIPTELRGKWLLQPDLFQDSSRMLLFSRQGQVIPGPWSSPWI